jgi:hypothetical protein
MQHRPTHNLRIARLRFSEAPSVAFTAAVVLALSMSACALRKFPAELVPAAGIVVHGPGTAPQLAFACCDQGIERMKALFADPDTIAQLKAIHAGIAVPTLDFSPERAEVVRSLNQAGIPVVAWMILSKEQGYYLNADTAAAAKSRVAEFEKWTSDNHLNWAAVGLDIEPNFNEFAELKTHPWRMLGILLSRSFNGGRIRSAKATYAALISDLQSRGYRVQTYLMPYIPAERDVGSTLLDRLLGTVDVRGNDEYLMLYTSVARPVGAGMIWSLGSSAQSIVIGVTDGDTTPGTGNGPLDWDEFVRDLIVAGHFSRHIGIYNLEGCVRQGFLPRLETLDWNQSVVIPAESIRRAERVGLLLRIALWTGSHALYLACALLLLLVWLAWSIRKRRLKLRRPGRSGSRPCS